MAIKKSSVSFARRKILLNHFAVPLCFAAWGSALCQIQAQRPIFCLVNGRTRCGLLPLARVRGIHSEASSAWLLGTASHRAAALCDPFQILLILFIVWKIKLSKVRFFKFSTRQSKTSSRCADFQFWFNQDALAGSIRERFHFVQQRSKGLLAQFVARL